MWLYLVIVSQLLPGKDRRAGLGHGRYINLTDGLTTLRGRRAALLQRAEIPARHRP